MSIHVDLDRNWVPRASEATRFIRIRILAPEVPGNPQDSLAVAFVIDRSGSMMEAKIELAKRAVVTGFDLLRPHDTFCVSAFDTGVDRVVGPQLATAENLKEARVLVREIEVLGCTNLSGGWMNGFTGIRECEATLRRIVLLSDGQANEGVTKPEDLALMVAAGLKSGVVSSMMGVGEYFDEHVMEEMAHHGGGNFIFIDDEKLIPQIMRQELRECLNVSVHNVVVEVKAPPGFKGKMKLLSRYLHDVNEQILEVRPGNLTSGQVLDLFVELELGELPPDDPQVFQVRVYDDDHVLKAPLAEASVVARYEPRPEDSLNEDVLLGAWQSKRSLGILRASRYNAEGEFEKANHLLHELARGAMLLWVETNIEGFATLYDKLVADAERYRLAMDPVLRKFEHSDSVYSSRSRLRYNSSLPELPWEKK